MNSTLCWLELCSSWRLTILIWIIRVVNYISHTVNRLKRCVLYWHWWTGVGNASCTFWCLKNVNIFSWNFSFLNLIHALHADTEDFSTHSFMENILCSYLAAWLLWPQTSIIIMTIGMCLYCNNAKIVPLSTDTVATWDAEILQQQRQENQSKQHLTQPCLTWH